MKCSKSRLTCIAETIKLLPKPKLQTTTYQSLLKLYWHRLIAGFFPTESWINSLIAFLPCLLVKFTDEPCRWGMSYTSTDGLRGVPDSPVKAVGSERCAMGTAILAAPRELSLHSYYMREEGAGGHKDMQLTGSTSLIRMFPHKSLSQLFGCLFFPSQPLHLEAAWHHLICTCSPVMIFNYWSLSPIACFLLLTYLK